VAENTDFIKREWAKNSVRQDLNIKVADGIVDI